MRVTHETLLTRWAELVFTQTLPADFPTFLKACEVQQQASYARTLGRIEALFRGQR